MRKRGQATVFVIAGIVLLFVATTLFYIVRMTDLEIGHEELLSTEEQVQRYVHACLEETSEMALLSVARKGGYDLLPDTRYVGNGFQTSYAYYHGTVWLRPLILMEEAIASETLRLMPACHRYLQDFRDQGFDVSLGEPAASATIGEGSVTVSFEQPVTVRKGGMSVTIDEFVHVIPARLFAMRNAAEMLLFTTTIEPRAIDQQYLLFLGESLGLDIDVLYNDLGDVIYLLQDHERTLLDGKPLVFMFATKIYLGEEPPLFLLPETNFTLVKDEESTIFVLAIDPNDDDLMYGSNSSAIKPDDDGIITYTPTAVGNETVRITVSDGIFIVGEEIRIEVVEEEEP